MRELLSKPWIIGCWFVAATAVMLGPIFVGQVLTVPDSDIVAQYYPLFWFYSEALHAGESFLWLPHIYSGFPVYLSQVAGFVDPVNVLIFSVFSGLDGMHVRLALGFLLAFVSSYLAARTIGLSRVASSLVGPAYLLAFHWRFLSNPITSNTLFLMPLLIYCVARAIESERGSWRFVLLGGAGLGWALLSGYTQVIVYAVMFGGMYALGHFFLLGGQRTLRRFVRVIYLYAAMVAIGAVVGLPQILPAAQFVPFTVRSEGIDYALTTLKLIEPGDLILSVIPDYLYVPYVTVGRKPLFVGALWFFLAVGGLLFSLVSYLRSRRSSARGERQALIISGLFVFALVAAFKWSPLFYLLHQLPVFEYFRFPFRFMFLGAFFLALLGGFGFDWAERLARERVVRWWAYIAAALSALVVLGIAATQLFGNQLVSLGDWLLSVGPARLGLSKDPSHYHEALERGLGAYRELLSFSDWSVWVPMALLLVSAGMFVALVRGSVTPVVFRKIAVVLAVLTFISVFVAGWRWFGPAEALGVEGSVLSSYVSEEDRGLYRSYSFVPYHSVSQYIPPQYKLSLDEERAMAKVMAASASPNTHIYSGIPSVDGYDQFMPTATLSAIEKLGGELAAGGVSNYGVRTFDERRDLLLKNLPLFGMMGGKHIVSGMPLEHPSLSLLGEPTVSEYGIPLYVYEYANPTPRYYAARSSVALPHKDFIDLVDNEEVAFGTRTYLDCADCTPGGAAEVSLLAEANGAFKFAVSASEPAYLVVSESLLPGWAATVDGAEAPIIRANGLYMAVAVPQGEHEVALEYRGMLGELTLLRAFGIVKPL